MKPKKGIVSPYVEIEIVGADFDNEKRKTATICKKYFNCHHRIIGLLTVNEFFYI